MSIYLDRYAWKESIFPNYSPHPDLEMVIVIPCYHEPEIEKALRSLDACSHPCKVVVMVIINESEDEGEEISNQNVLSLGIIEKLQPQLCFEILVTHQKLSPKKAGVGLARKIGIDEAVRFFEKIDTDGIIVCYDADCTCQSNYLDEIYTFYNDGQKEVGIVFYEHDLSNNTEAITNYEIYLRYYVNAIRNAGFPYAYQTLGSCITVKSKRYQKEGGMNTRKAGEDFYFLHKVIPNGKFGEINTTTIHPSARISDRVPFGTGHAINKYLNSNEENYLTYNPKIFEELKEFISQTEILYNQKEPLLSPCLKQFLDENNFDYFYNEMLRQSTDFSSFQKRFFSWLDGFRILKFVHFARDHFYGNVVLAEVVDWLFNTYSDSKDKTASLDEVLTLIRILDRKVS